MYSLWFSPDSTAGGSVDSPTETRSYSASAHPPLNPGRPHTHTHTHAHAHTHTSTHTHTCTHTHTHTHTHTCLVKKYCHRVTFTPAFALKVTLIIFDLPQREIWIESYWIHQNYFTAGLPSRERQHDASSQVVSMKYWVMFVVDFPLMVHSSCLYVNDVQANKSVLVANMNAAQLNAHSLYLSSSANDYTSPRPTACLETVWLNMAATQ